MSPAHISIGPFKIEIKRCNHNNNHLPTSTVLIAAAAAKQEREAMVYSSRENFTATMLHSNEFDSGVTSRSLTMVDETVVNDWQISQNHFSDSSSVPPPPVWGSAGPGAGSGTSKKSPASTNTGELSDEQVTFFAMFLSSLICKIV